MGDAPSLVIFDCDGVLVDSEPIALRLLRETLVTSGTMTNRVDRLAARGLVERLPDPKDRRGVLVRLTPAGRTTVDGAFEALIGAERELLVDLPAKDRTQLASLLRTLMTPFAGPVAD